jgi:hypothetical protein
MEEDEEEDESVVEHGQDEEGEGGSKEEVEVIDDGPPRNITKNIKGQERTYYYVKTVKGAEELDQFRFKVCYKKRIVLNEISIRI